MKWGEVPPGIESAERLTGIFGRWPSFHDAEVLTLLYDRVSSVGGFDIVAVIHLWEMTNEVDPNGYFILIKHTRATFRFYDCSEVALDEFNLQNVISGLVFERDAPGTFPPAEVTHRSLSPHLVVFEGCYGLAGSLRCKRVEVVDAFLIDPDTLESTAVRGSARAFPS